MLQIISDSFNHLIVSLMASKFYVKLAVKDLQKSIDFF